MAKDAVAVNQCYHGVAANSPAGAIQKGPAFLIRINPTAIVPRMRMLTNSLIYWIFIYIYIYIYYTYIYIYICIMCIYIYICIIIYIYIYGYSMLNGASLTVSVAL